MCEVACDVTAALVGKAWGGAGMSKGQVALVVCVIGAVCAVAAAGLVVGAAEIGVKRLKRRVMQRWF